MARKCHLGDAPMSPHLSLVPSVNFQDSLLAITWVIITFLEPARGFCPLADDTKEAASKHNPSPCEHPHPQSLDLGDFPSSVLHWSQETFDPCL